MHSRISELFAALKNQGIKQYNIAELLGVSETAVSAWKNGRRSITEQAVRAICREFQVSEIWLRTGEGDMFSEPDDDQIITAFAGDVLNGETETEFDRKMILLLAEMTEAEKLALSAFIKRLGILFLENAEAV